MRTAWSRVDIRGEETFDVEIGGRREGDLFDLLLRITADNPEYAVTSVPARAGTHRRLIPFTEDTQLPLEITLTPVNE